MKKLTVSEKTYFHTLSVLVMGGVLGIKPTELTPQPKVYFF
jgi:hypothetical protein